MTGVSVVMPAYNEELSIVGSLDSLLRQSRLPEEVIVADGGSTDGTRELVAGLASGGVSLRIVDNPARRVGAGRNAGIAAARFPIVACIDAGNSAEPEWLEKLTEAVEAIPGDSVAVGRIVPQASSRFELCVAGVVYPYLMRPPASEGERRRREEGGKDLLSSSTIAFRRTVWERVGGYPEWLEAGEDKLFARKLRAAGIRVVRCPDAVVYHHMRRGPLSLFRQFLRYSRGTGLSAQTPPHVPQLAMRYLASAVLAALAAVAGDPYLRLLLVAAVGTGGLLHLARQGYIPFSRSMGGLTPAALALVPLALLARDLGALLGHGVGNAERWLHPGARRQLRDYLA